MAHAASVSLIGVLVRFYNSPDRFAHNHFPHSLPFLRRLHEMAESMRDFDFEKYRPAGEEYLENQITDALLRAEDVIESYWFSLLHSSDSDQNVWEDMDSTTPSHDMANSMQNSYFEEESPEREYSMQSFDFEIEIREGEYLEKRIRDASLRDEHNDESYWLSFLHSFKSQSLKDIQEVMQEVESTFSRDIGEVMQEIESDMERMKMLEHDCEQDSVASVLSFIDDLPPKCKNKMVGLDGNFEELKCIILRTLTPIRRLGAMVVHGMGGIGKTSLAISFYNDSDVRDYFSIGAWVKIPLQYCVRDILLCLLHTLEVFNHGKDEEITRFGLIVDNINDERLEKIVHERLVNERYLVVVDCCDISINCWNYIKSILPDSNNGSRIILTNRWEFSDWDNRFGYFEKHFLDVSHSWELLREQVFGDKPCPHVLERIGKRIAKNCEGLPLAIITVGSHFAKAEKTVEYWNKIADSRNSVAYAADGAPMFEQLSLSYKQLQFFQNVVISPV